LRLAESWQKAEIPGPKKALIITKPEIVSALIKRSKRPILIVGHEAAKVKLDEGELLLDYLIRLAKLTNMTVIATAHVVKDFVAREFQPDAWMPVVDIANRLQDPDWKGLDGKGSYDLAILTGMQYYLQWVILSALKHFSSGLKTISLDRFYQPNASWSFPNISFEEWRTNLKVIEEKLRG